MKRRIALAGNPNTGKTTLFNRLTGAQARVGNYPGVTVELEQADIALGSAGVVEVVDVPGSYSLVARSQEEQVAIDALLENVMPVFHPTGPCMMGRADDPRTG